MDPASIQLSGAVQLNPKPAAGSSPPGTPQPGVVDVTEATFEAEVLQRSATTPVVIDFWADWCAPCKQLSPILEKLAGEAAGAWVLAKIDVDANPQLAQAAAVQGIPAVKAVLNAQVVGEFTGALPEHQVRQWIEQLLQAVRQGGFGSVDGAPEAVDPAAEPIDPDLAAGDEALMAGDLDTATDAYQRLYDRPGAAADLRQEARAGLARAGLLRRAEALDPEALQQRITADPDDVAAASGVADALVLADRAADAFTLLLAVVRRTAGAERDAARQHLLGLFDLLGDADPLVGRARRDLASALF